MLRSVCLISAVFFAEVKITFYSGDPSENGIAVMNGSPAALVYLQNYHAFVPQFLSRETA